MFDDGRGRIGEFLDELPGGIEINQVVVGQLLAVKLPGSCNPARPVGVQRGLLMRVLPVSKVNVVGTCSADC